VNPREIVDGPMSILSTGCRWRAIPKDPPPRSTLHDCFDPWNWDGTLDRIHHALYVGCRDRAEREASLAIIDSHASTGSA
jgi:transposase